MLRLLARLLLAALLVGLFAFRLSLWAPTARWLTDAAARLEREGQERSGQAEQITAGKRSIGPRQIRTRERSARLRQPRTGRRWDGSTSLPRPSPGHAVMREKKGDTR
jgi:hypothetical protein